MSRGNIKQDIFLSDDDRLDFLEKLADVVSECAWVCYAYCLMGNHYHLLIETPQANLSEGMHKLNSYYSKRFNWKQEKVGHLLQGRYTSRLVEKDEHLWEIIRYMPLNPVKAGLVSEPEQWIWSSYRPIAGLAPAPGFLDVEYTLSLFGNDKSIAKQEYMRFVADGLLLERLTDQTVRLTLQELFQGAWNKEQRNTAMRIAHSNHNYKMTEIAAYLSISLSTVSRAIHK